VSSIPTEPAEFTATALPSTGEVTPVLSALRIYNAALVRLSDQHEYRRQLLLLAIKLGKSGSEERLVDILNTFGTEETATDFLNSGSPMLRTAAEGLATRNGDSIQEGDAWRTVTWGIF
jgi:hypothetical protein